MQMLERIQHRPALTVFYNTKCPICDAGINRQRNRLYRLANAGIVDFKDINLEPEVLAHLGVGLEDIRRRLHALDDAGRLLVGADVATAVWSLTPGDRWLATLLGNKFALPMTRYVYDRFAGVLYRWNKRRGSW